MPASQHPSSPESPQYRLGTRITVTLPPNDYDTVRRIAKAKKVSASWVVRDAVEIYVQASKKSKV
jgi:predicted transcriptional regulator